MRRAPFLSACVGRRGFELFKFRISRFQCWVMTVKFRSFGPSKSDCGDRVETQGDTRILSLLGQDARRQVVHARLVCTICTSLYLLFIIVLKNNIIIILLITIDGFNIVHSIFNWWTYWKTFVSLLSVALQSNRKTSLPTCRAEHHLLKTQRNSDREGEGGQLSNKVGTPQQQTVWFVCL